MFRLFAIDAVFFLLPFAAYAMWLAFGRRGVGAAMNWPLRTVGFLSLTGTVMVIVVLMVSVSFSGSPVGGEYHPATLKDGRVVPGSIR